MHVELSDEEYHRLLDILHLVDVILFGQRNRGPHNALIQKLYSMGFQEGLTQSLSYDSVLNRYVPTQEFEEKTTAHALLEEFASHLFWNELINRLTVRDAAEAAGGTDHLNAMTEEEQQGLDKSIRQKYVEEFETNGLANVTIVQHFREDWGGQAQTSD